MLTNRSIPSATVIPVVQYPDVIAAAEWLCEAFGFRERLRIGKHRVQLAVGDDGALVVAEGAAAGDGHSIMIRVEDAGLHAQRAAAAGARVSRPGTYPYGERQYGAVDPWGHAWTFTQTVDDVDPASWGGEIRE
jgi:uncharacterized glyoxalase superfamily protein PhnB